MDERLRRVDRLGFLSVVIPAFNEARSLPVLMERLVKTFEENGFNGEFIIVNDGSMDGTATIADEWAGERANVFACHHRRRLGKTAALLTGFERASGDVLILIDADLQYAPEELPKLLGLVAEGYDVVNGWRKHRKSSVFRKFPSRVYNFFSRLSFGLTLHDHNSGLKALRREVVENIDLRPGHHRFILNLAHYYGYRVGEVEIQHFPRQFGKTKYGSSRLVLGLLDLVSLRFQLAFMERPMVLFGLAGIVLFLTGFLTAFSAVVLNVFFGHPYSWHYGRLILASLLMMTGVQSFFFGFVADMIANLKMGHRQKMRGGSPKEKRLRVSADSETIDSNKST